MTLLIDPRDAHLLTQYNYRLRGRRWVRTWHHPILKQPRERLLSEDIMNPKEGFSVIHINGNPDDFRRENLRTVEKQQNKKINYGLTDQGRASLYINNNIKGSQKYRGISRSKNRFKAQITIKGKNHFLGLFDTEVEAAEAYDLAVVQHLDLKDILNFPEKYLDYKAKLGKLSEQEAQQKLDSFSPEYTEVGESYLHLIDSL